MKLRELYNFAVKLGMESDPRDKETVNGELLEAKEAYDELKDDEKEFFDTESLTNPYADSRILYGEDNREINKMLVGIDMETPELLLASELNRRGENIDLVFTHHPEGPALAALAKVMNLQSHRMEDFGVRPGSAEGIMGSRINAVGRSVGASNYFRAVDSARLLDIPYICLHTVCDNLVNTYLSQYLEKSQIKTLSDILKALKEIPEYKTASQRNNPPRIDVGDKKGKAGKIYVDFTGGTSGPKESYSKLAEAGVNTIISMHNNEEQIKIAKEINLNLICAGHMASDSIGINLLLDALEKENVTALAGGGLIRVKRNKA